MSERWLYRIRPTVAHWGRFGRADAGSGARAPCHEYRDADRATALEPDPDPRRRRLSFLKASAPSPPPATPARRPAWRAHVYLITRSMEDEYFYNADAEMLFVPQQGALRFCTEFGDHRRRARRDRRHPARREAARRSARWTGARLPVRELRRRFHVSPSAARSAPTAWRTPGLPAPVAAYEDREVALARRM